MKDQGHQAMWPQMSAALAAIDEALGLPADGCNSTAQTLAAIKKLKDGRDALLESLYAELDTNFRLRDLGGAQPDEPMTPFIERVIAERDRFRAALLDCARQAERLKKPCGMDPEGYQAVRNGKYQNISTTAHVALGTIRGPQWA